MKGSIWFIALLELTVACSSPDRAADVDFQRWRAEINQIHDAARFGDGAPYLLDSRRAYDYSTQFAASHCAFGSKKMEPLFDEYCNRAFGRALMDKLHEKYFATNLDELRRHCKENPLTCEDTQAAEALFRILHNAEIERSRSEQLHALEEWHDHRIDRAELERELQINLAAPFYQVQALRNAD